MAEIEATPPDQRAGLVQQFYARLVEIAGMPQTRIAVGAFKGYEELGSLVGGLSNSLEVTVDLAAHKRDPIFWEEEIANFFHEQGHEWKDLMLQGKAPTSHPNDLAKLRKNQQNYVNAKVSGKMYKYNPLELHAQKFGDIGLGIVGEWKKHR